MSFCVKCGKEIPEDAKLCPYCGTPTVEENNESLEQQSAQQMQQPVQQMEQPMQQSMQVKPAKQPTNGFGIASMVLGICAVALICIPIVPLILGIVGLVLGIVGIVVKKQSKKGTAIAGIVTSLVAVVLWVLVLVGVFSLTSSNVQRSKESKDLMALDNIAAAANVAIANLQATGKDVIDLGTTEIGVQDSADTASEKGKIQHEIYNSVSSETGKTESDTASGDDIHIYLSYDVQNRFLSVGYAKEAPAAGSKVNGIPCKYISGSSFEVTTQSSDDSVSDAIDEINESITSDDDDEDAGEDVEDYDDEDDEKDDNSSSENSDSFREMLDEYEEFIGEYVDFMKEYSKNPLDNLDKYGEFIDKYTKFAKKIDKVKQEDVSADDWAYYLEVTGRVVKKLAEIGE